MSSGLYKKYYLRNVFASDTFFIYIYIYIYINGIWHWITDKIWYALKPTQTKRINILENFVVCCRISFPYICFVFAFFIYHFWIWMLSKFFFGLAQKKFLFFMALAVPKRSLVEITDTCLINSSHLNANGCFKNGISQTSLCIFPFIYLVEGLSEIFRIDGHNALQFCLWSCPSPPYCLDSLDNFISISLLKVVIA